MAEDSIVLFQAVRNPKTAQAHLPDLLIMIVVATLAVAEFPRQPSIHEGFPAHQTTRGVFLSIHVYFLREYALRGQDGQYKKVDFYFSSENFYKSIESLFKTFPMIFEQKKQKTSER